MEEFGPSFRVHKKWSQTSRSRLGLLIAVAVLAVIASPMRKTELSSVSAISANPTPVCVGAYCTVTFPYTGDNYTWTAPTNGTYDLKVWGAQGGNDAFYPTTVAGGRGGYAAGTVTLSAGTSLHIYVGGQGTSCTSSSWGSSGGGGGTDIRLVGGTWNSSSSLLSRIIVAGGGGGRHGKQYESSQKFYGNDGGGENSPSFTYSSYTMTGSTQTGSGTSNYSSSGVAVGSFGFANPTAQSNTCSTGGWNGGARGSDNWAHGGGGGGWYGGVTSWPLSAGGSGYVLTSSSYKPASYSPTSAYNLTSTSLIAGNSTMPSPDGATMTGREGHGVATIKYLNVPTPSFSASVGSPSNQSTSIAYTVNYSENVSGITMSDFQLSGTSTGWSIASLAGSGSGPYTLTVSGSSVTSGTVTLTQLQNSVLGQSTGQNGPVSATSSSPISIDVDKPSATISSSPSSPAAGMTQTFGMSFSESVSGIAAADFSNTGTALGCVFSPSATSGTSINVVVTQCQEGTLQLRLAENSVSDAATNLGPTSPLQSSIITLQGSALTVTATVRSINFGGSWTDAYTTSGMIGADTIASAAYSYSGTTTSGASYGPSATKPTLAGSYTITPTVVFSASNSNRYAVTYVAASLTISRIAQSALTITSTSGTYGSGLTLTTSGGSGSGSVTFAVSSGTCSVEGNTVTFGNAGSACVISATKAQDTNYNAISSVDTTVSIAKANQAPLTLVTTSGTFGESLTLASSGGSGSGAVSYVVVSGTCTVVGSTLTPGNASSACVVRATKASETNYNAISSADTTVIINKANQATLMLTSTSATYGSSMSLTASGGSGSGAVSYVVVSGTCVVVGSTLTPGNAGSTCVVRATKATDTNYLVVNSADTTVAVARASQSTLSVSSTSATFGSTLSLTSVGGSGTGAVSFTVTSGSCTILGTSLIPGDAGSLCVVTATKARDDNYIEISSSATTIAISRANQSTLSISTTTAVFGQTLTLASSGGSGNGAVSYSVVSGTCSVSGNSLTPGNANSSCVIRATKAQDMNFNERSSANTAITVNKASQSGLNITSPLSFITGSNLSLYATGGQSSGSLSWSLNSGTCVMANATLTSSRGGISCSVEVTRAGDSNYNSSSVSATISVEKVTQVLTFRSTPPASPVVGGTYTLQVESDASLAPTVVIANSSASVCSISAGVVTFNAVGTCVISASQSGNDSYAPAAASQSLSVGVVVTTTVPSSATPDTGGVTSGSTSTIPQRDVAAVASTSSTTSTTSTTTTTLPADPSNPVLGPDGQAPELEVGEATAIIRGKRVKIQTSTENGQLTMTLPGNVVMRIGTTSTASGNVQIGSDGVLRMYGDSSVNVGVSGFVPKTTYTMFMFSKPLELGRGETGDAGTIDRVVTVPKDVETGNHTLQINGVGKGSEVVSISMGFEVIERESNTRIAASVILLAIALALLGGRPIFKRRRRA